MSVIVHAVSIKWLGVAAGGQVGVCSCGDRQEKATEQRQEAQQWGDKHLIDVKVGRLYRGPRKPSLKTLHGYYVEQAESQINSKTERALWKQLADEIERTLPALKNDIIPGQMSLLELDDKEQA